MPDLSDQGSDVERKMMSDVRDKGRTQWPTSSTTILDGDWVLIVEDLRFQLCC